MLAYCDHLTPTQLTFVPGEEPEDLRGSAPAPLIASLHLDLVLGVLLQIICQIIFSPCHPAWAPT